MIDSHKDLKKFNDKVANSMSKKIIVIAGGGTGGHIYPGIAIAKSLQKTDSNVEVHFVGSYEGLENKIVPREKFPLHFVASGKLNMKGHLFQRIKTILKIPWGFVQSIFILLKLKPVYVIGVGGYASGPFVLIATLMGIPCGIWEANAHPGMANRWLSRFVKNCFLVFEEAKHYLSHNSPLVLGMPLREEMDLVATELKSKEKKLSLTPLRILCFGGSQGARAINNALSDVLLAHPEWEGHVEVVHQTGSLDFKAITEKYQNCKVKVQIFEFIYNMPEYYQWADLLICRGGASTIAEASAFATPPIVIPLPLADAHQQKNAESLVAKSAGVMILQKDLTPETLFQKIEELRTSPEKIRSMSKHLQSNYIPHGTQQIVKEILQ